jgi:hypothetical protein
MLCVFDTKKFRFEMCEAVLQAVLQQPDNHKACMLSRLLARGHELTSDTLVTLLVHTSDYYKREIFLIGQPAIASLSPVQFSTIIQSMNDLFKVSFAQISLSCVEGTIETVFALLMVRILDSYKCRFLSACRPKITKLAPEDFVFIFDHTADAFKKPLLDVFDVNISPDLLYRILKRTGDAYKSMLIRASHLTSKVDGQTLDWILQDTSDPFKTIVIESFGARFFVIDADRVSILLHTSDDYKDAVRKKLTHTQEFSVSTWLQPPWLPKKKNIKPLSWLQNLLSKPKHECKPESEFKMELSEPSPRPAWGQPFFATIAKTESKLEPSTAAFLKEPAFTCSTESKPPLSNESSDECKPSNESKLLRASNESKPLHASKDNQHDHMCVICLSSHANSVFVPCFHKVSCVNCGSKLTTCPICRYTIELFHEVYE